MKEKVQTLHQMVLVKCASSYHYNLRIQVQQRVQEHPKAVDPSDKGTLNSISNG